MKLLKEDYQYIKDLAHTEYINNSSKNEPLFLCKCYVKAVLAFLKKRSDNEKI